MSKKIKYIIAISVVTLIMALGIITLIMGLVPVGGNTAINLPDDVYIYTNSRGIDIGKIEYHRGYTQQDTEKVNKIFNLFNECFEQKALKAFFNGELGSGLTFVEDMETEINKYKDDTSKITIVFHYDEVQPIKGVDTYWGGSKYVCFTVDGSSEWKDIVLGLPDALNSEESESGSVSIWSQRSYRGKACTAKLYDYVYSIIKDHNN